MASASRDAEHLPDTSLLNSNRNQGSTKSRRCIDFNRVKQGRKNSLGQSMPNHAQVRNEKTSS